jgi:hypothetical protein
MGLAKIILPIRDKGWQIYTRPYELNIIGLRSSETIANKFDDEIHVVYRDNKGKTNHHIYKATTDPGTYWLKNPSMPKGTAILKEGQYKNAFMLGMHRGKYTALVQAKPVTVYRDYNRDAILDMDNGTEQTGIFGIEIHHASATGTTNAIDEYSAGCQVFQNPDEYKEFITLCEKHRKLYGNQFTYTLIDFRMTRRAMRKHLAYLTMTMFALAIFFVKGDSVFDFPPFLTLEYWKNKKGKPSQKGGGKK